METRVEEYRGTRPGAIWGRTGEVAGTVRIITGVLPSGLPFRAETFVPDRDGEETEAWRARIRTACRTYAEDCVRTNGLNRAKEMLAE